MPSFTEWTEVEVDVDVSVDDFLSECDSDDIKEIITALQKDGYLTPKDLLTDSSDTELSQALSKIAHFRNLLTIEEEELIKKIGNRVCLYSL
jgi:hypothetical protein